MKKFIPISNLIFPMIPNARLELDGHRIQYLLAKTLARISEDYMPVVSIRLINLKVRGKYGARNFTGVTRCNYRSGKRTGVPNWQIITFYSYFLNRLTDSAVIAVMVHELAHAWLNEHQSVERSERRERSTEKLMREWGFTKEMGALASEAVEV